MPRDLPPDLSLILTFLRSGQGWSQSQLARAVGISPQLINDYERGRKALSRERLGHLIASLGLSPAEIDALLGVLSSIRSRGRSGPDSPDSPRASYPAIDAVASQAGRLAASFARSLLTLVTLNGEALQARQHAEMLWARLEARTPEQRRLLVEDAKEYRSWALCERIAAASIDAAANHPKKALELAHLALQLAELVPGEEAWRWRLQGYVWSHIANARRACNDLPAADEAMARARKLWEAGAAADPGLLSASCLPSLEAVLHRDHRRLAEALRCSEEALALDRGELRGKILLSKANILKVLNDPEGSTAALQEAAPLIDLAREPRLALILRFNLVADLCHLGRVEEAAMRLAEVRQLAERLGEELDLVRVVWLEGKVAAGRGHVAEAQASFEQVRRRFTISELAYDCALVSLDLALVLLMRGQTAKVQELAKEMVWLFRAQCVHQEALAALRVFCDAARREAATMELTHRVTDFLFRAQHDHRLRFETVGTETP